MSDPSTTNDPPDPRHDIIRDAEQLRDLAVDGITPKAAAFPRLAEEVAAQLKQAAAKGLKVVPCGSRTKMTIGAPAERVDLVLGLELLNRILDHDHDNLTLTVEAGARLGAVQAALRERSQFLPLDPPFADRATIGGILATNSCGPRRLLYGSPRDLVTGLRAALPNGKIIKMGGKTVKNVAGFDLSKLFIGSLGTLGVILEATFRILPLPETSCTQFFLFDDPDAAWTVATKLIDGLLAPAAVDVLNRTAAAKCRAITGSSKKKACGLAVAFEGFVEAVERQTRELTAMAEGAAVVLSLREKDQDLFWRPATDGFTSDEGDCWVRGKISVPISQTRAAAGDAERTLPTSALVAHAASGVVHFTCPSEGVTVETLAALRKRVNALGGWLNLEAAPRAIKRGVGVWDIPPGGIEIMRRIRRAFDPKGTLNPGRFVSGV